MRRQEPMNITIPGEAAGTARDALVLYIYRATMDSGLYAGTPEGDEAEKRLTQGKYAIRSLPEDSSDMASGVSFSAEVAEIVKAALIFYIVWSERDIETHRRWTPERGVAKKRLAEGKNALHHLAWAIAANQRVSVEPPALTRLEGHGEERSPHPRSSRANAAPHAERRPPA
jgi:hypothetical protein